RRFVPARMCGGRMVWEVRLGGAEGRGFGKLRVLGSRVFTILSVRPEGTRFFRSASEKLGVTWLGGLEGKALQRTPFFFHPPVAAMPPQVGGKRRFSGPAAPGTLWVTPAKTPTA